MTKAKKLKRAARARSQKTGESYATARLRLLEAREESASEKPATTKVDPKTIDPRGAVSDAAVQRKTGKGLAHWFGVLDAFDVRENGHTEAAKHLREEHAVSAWYSQGITVAYERAHGLRKKNQTSRGFGFTVSRVLPVDAERALPLLARKRAREGWLAASPLELAEPLAAAMHGKRFKRGDDGRAWLRLTKGGLPDGMSIELRLSVKPDGRAHLTFDVWGLPDKAAVERWRPRVRAAMDAYKKTL